MNIVQNEGVWSLLMMTDIIHLLATDEIIMKFLKESTRLADEVLYGDDWSNSGTLSRQSRVVNTGSICESSDKQHGSNFILQQIVAEINRRRKVCNYAIFMGEDVCEESWHNMRFCISLICWPNKSIVYNCTDPTWVETWNRTRASWVKAVPTQLCLFATPPPPPFALTLLKIWQLQQTQLYNNSYFLRSHGNSRIYNGMPNRILLNNYC